MTQNKPYDQFRFVRLSTSNLKNGSFVCLKLILKLIILSNAPEGDNLFNDEEDHLAVKVCDTQQRYFQV